MTIDTVFTHFPSLTTQRLQLRQLCSSDAEAFFAIRSDQQVLESYGKEPYQSLEEARVALQRLQTLYDQHEAIFWGITLKGAETVIGSCTFWNFGPDLLYAEIGYELHRSYWRQGIMSEALPAILSYGFSELALHRIEANLFSSNTPSKELLLKLGFTQEGMLRQRSFFHNQFKDELYFGLLKDEWRKTV